MLDAHLRDSRARTLDLVVDLADALWLGEVLPIVNPILWEVGHVAWFQERWVLRHRRGDAPLLAHADALYDSSRVPHATRWSLPLPGRDDTLRFMEAVLERALLCIDESSPERAYFHRLALFHEDMHAEALTYSRQTLVHPAPRSVASPEIVPATLDRGPLPGDVEIPGCRYRLGAAPDEPFVFDNEKWAHPVEVAAFRMARAPVTNEAFSAFVDAGGYDADRWWSPAGKAWRASTGARHPVYWVRRSGGWHERRFQATTPLEPHRPVIHVSWFEAEAFCSWAGRRLPTEAEWELAASTPDKRRFPWGDAPPTSSAANLDARSGGPVDVAAFPAGDSPFGCRQMIGNVWEWTASDFAPYPGFVIDPYEEYSAPWFAAPHKVLRGGCWATRGRLLRNTWRNFYPPHRRDVFAGFRTCAR
jgi:gamma-glutamyl hercynylcysteine S-oxide synthase